MYGPTTEAEKISERTLVFRPDLSILLLRVEGERMKLARLGYIYHSDSERNDLESGACHDYNVPLLGAPLQRRPEVGCHTLRKHGLHAIPMRIAAVTVEVYLFQDDRQRYARLLWGEGGGSFGRMVGTVLRCDHWVLGSANKPACIYPACCMHRPSAGIWGKRKANQAPARQEDRMFHI